MKTKSFSVISGCGDTETFVICSSLIVLLNSPKSFLFLIYLQDKAISDRIVMKYPFKILEYFAFSVLLISILFNLF